MLRCRAFYEIVVKTPRLLALLTCLPLAGCASPEGKPTATSPCAFEQVWDTSIAALEGVRLLKADKDAGLLETNWVEVGSATQAGIMQRDVNKERVKYVIEVRREGHGAAATVLQAVISQLLLPRCDKPGRVAAFEIMINTPSVAALIRDNKTFRINSDIQTGAKYGMVTLDGFLMEKYMQGMISREEVVTKSQDPTTVQAKLQEYELAQAMRLGDGKLVKA